MNGIEITKEFVKKHLPEREDNSNKGSFGNVINIAGSLNYRGAAFLSTISPLKVGAGYVCIASIKEVIDTVSKLCPEAVLLPLKNINDTIAEGEFEKILKFSEKYKVISVGCGISSMNYSQNNIENFVEKLLIEIKERKNPIVIDADGLNIIAKKEITDLPKNTILTPHPMELSRLLNTDIKEIQKNRIKYAKIASEKYNAVVVLKGSNTIITNENDTYISPFKNSALAKAGTGDVLTGMISGFLAQGTSIINAAILGVFIHGLSGEIAAKDLSKYSVLASDVINYIPNAIKEIQKDI